MSTCYLNGQWQALESARISPMDRGFLFGDGVYEVIPAYSGHPFRLDEHLRRLANSLAAIGLPNPLPHADWAALVREAVARNPWPDQSVYLQVSRGVGAVRNHAFPAQVTPTVFLMSEPLLTPDAATRAQGVAAVSAADFRWLRCDLKTVSLLANCLLKQHAAEHGCAETVLFRDGFLTEGAASSIFVVVDGVLLAPPKSHLMLPGITYDVVLELAADRGLPHQVREVLEDEVRGADELWMASSTREVLPITRLDERPVGRGRPGPMAARMIAWYQEFKQEVMRCGG
ncbi:D-amino acid aminotransferase [Nitrogeniibacter mangrovi]|uniref:D-amino acid aminotransferase n=1 Tax=Nitrogeniibacter mangrovi TaxID=2016596 RepID=A0A6C1AYC6_9RHOO|nr:D-amino acid aminotransferase [Nitrogeniibacter mangrovi]QID16371.1 D-amino acid aminotransferase [Nitrogeniibacter mangrovi]